MLKELVINCHLKDILHVNTLANIVILLMIRNLNSKYTLYSNYQTTSVLLGISQQYGVPYVTINIIETEAICIYMCVNVCMFVCICMPV